MPRSLVNFVMEVDEFKLPELLKKTQWTFNCDACENISRQVKYPIYMYDW